MKIEIALYLARHHRQRPISRIESRKIICVCVCVKIQEKSINDEIYQFEKSQFPRENKERDVEMKARSKDQTGPTIIYELCVYFQLTCGLVLKGHFTNDKPFLINPSTIAHARIRTFNR